MATPGGSYCHDIKSFFNDRIVNKHGGKNEDDSSEKRERQGDTGKEGVNKGARLMKYACTDAHTGKGHHETEAGQHQAFAPSRCLRRQQPQHKGKHENSITVLKSLFRDIRFRPRDDPSPDAAVPASVR